MNISCTVGMAAPHAEPETSFYTVLEQAETNTTLRYVLGPWGVSMTKAIIRNSTP